MKGRGTAIGAVVGGAIALAITLAFDPAEGTGSEAYEGGARFGEIARYVLFGAACGACVERLRAGARGGLLWGVGALAAAALVIGPAIDTAGEGTPEERFDTGRARTDFIAGCTDNSRAQGVPEHTIAPYCKCMWATLERDERLDEIAEIADSGAQPPRWIVEVAQRCAAA